MSIKKIKKLEDRSGEGQLNFGGPGQHPLPPSGPGLAMYVGMYHRYTKEYMYACMIWSEGLSRYGEAFMELDGKMS